MDYLLIFLGLAFTIAGLIGCIIPSIPGPPLNFIALLLLNWVDSSIFSNEFMLIFFFSVATVTFGDYMLPLSGKAFGVSRYGIWGSMLGMLAGIIFFPPFGMLIGIAVGAVVGELYAGKENSEALKAGLFTFLVSILMIVVKLVLSVIMSYHFFKETVKYIF
ncbi:MAG: DUF456 domain-containing protein [Ignavibacteriae bacterium]|nr:DUF456 domain-containing protein [Ignavibacteriota bacterium]NOG98518.1 DUF456 domain-containing protein [Ignavibacteriota bacterium]